VRRAFTLLELTITAVVLLVVTVLSTLLLLRTTSAGLRGTLRVDMQQQAVTAMQRLIGDMRKSSPAGVSVSSGNPRAIAICPISQPQLRPGELEPVQEDGRLRWSSFFLIYQHNPDTEQLLYREWPPGSVPSSPEETAIVSPRRLSVPRLTQVLAGTTPVQQVVASGVTALNITYPPLGSDELYIQPLTLQLVQRRKGNTGRPEPETFSYTRTVFLAEQR
jgi:hypothetical protein